MATAVAPPPVNVSDLSAQFMSHAEAVLKHNQLSLEPAAKTTLAVDFNQGAKVMITSNRASAADIGEAQYGVGVIAQGIVLQARAANVQTVPAGIIQKVKSFFCPPGIWPFC